jgi:hypothetical protein
VCRRLRDGYGQSARQRGAKGVLTKTRALLGVGSQRCGQDRRLGRRNAKGFHAGSSGGQKRSVPHIPALDPQHPSLARSVRPQRATNIEQDRHEVSSPPRLRRNRPLSPARWREGTSGLLPPDHAA